MSVPFNAAQAALAMAIECLGARCADYGRVLVETGLPVLDCDTLAVVIGNARAVSGNCAGRVQMRSHLDVLLARCCEPVGDLTATGYTPPSPEAITEAVACLTRDVWAVYECMACSACDTLGAIKGVTACCDRETGPPEIVWGPAAGGCRYASVRIPLVFTACCTPTQE